MTVSVLAAGVLAANPGPAVHLAALGLVIVVALTVYGVVRWRRRREAAQAESQPNSTSSPRRSSQTPPP